MTNAEKKRRQRARTALLPCDVIGCTNPRDRCSGAHRMCAAHFQRIVRTGSAQAFTPVRRYARPSPSTPETKDDHR